MTSVDDSSTMSTYDFEPLGDAGGGTYDCFCFYIDSRVVLESYEVIGNLSGMCCG
jgi:hypothetical protein